ncbi:MAG: hypothetical protein RLZZ272_1704, partial [Actinomycetota bacterium]
MTRVLRNLRGGQWVDVAGGAAVDVTDP